MRHTLIRYSADKIDGSDGSIEESRCTSHAAAGDSATQFLHAGQEDPVPAAPRIYRRIDDHVKLYARNLGRSIVVPQGPLKASLRRAQRCAAVR